jgi:Ras-related GTP-binding protein A/B
MGMENAGKTTIVDLLFQETEETPKKPPNMKPTKGLVRRSLTQRNIVIWDFGGQELYRNEYIANPESYLYTISYFYFVLDVQDYYRYISAVMYFFGIFQLIRKFSPDSELFIIFHKMDPNFDPSEKNLKKQFLERVEPYLQVNKASFTMYDTTIFDLKSIKVAFSQI